MKFYSSYNLIHNICYTNWIILYFSILELENLRREGNRILSRVRYGASGATKPAGPWPNFPLCPGLPPRAGFFFFCLLPLALSGPALFKTTDCPPQVNFPCSWPCLFTCSLLKHRFFDRCGCNFLVINVKFYATSYWVFYCFMGLLI